MNILYISNLSTNIAAGLNWSVPASIRAQSKIDNVFWVNLTNVEMDHWKEVKSFHNLNEFERMDIECFPTPFNHPDVVVFEGFYHPKDPKIARVLVKRNIPYIIIPRSALTKTAQKGGFLKRIKKDIANLLIFKRYTKNALAIQYLTKAESMASGKWWNKKSFIVPNGFHPPLIKKEHFSEQGLRAVFIGRLDFYQKGLDELLKACAHDREYLIEQRFSLDIYGPKRYDWRKIEREIDLNNLSSFVRLHNEVTGKEKEDILLNADLFILPSRFEGHPMGLIEALNYGLPCLVAPGSNMLTEIQEYNAGWTCETNAKSIADSLRKIFNEKKFLKDKGHNAQILGINYDWTKIAKRFHDTLWHLLNPNISKN